MLSSEQIIAYQSEIEKLTLSDKKCQKNVKLSAYTTPANTLSLHKRFARRVVSQKRITTIKISINMAKKIQYTPEMKKVIDELGLKDENIMYINIIREPLERILSGEKTVEFRDLSDFWLKKVANFNSKGEYVSDKPITHILFQNGMDKPPHAKRALVEMKYNIDKEEKIENPDSPKTQYILKEAEKEGFALDDTYLAIVLGKVVFRENI